MTAGRVEGVRICESAGIGRCRSGQAEPKHINKLRGGAEGMCAAAQITQAVQPLDGQPQAGEQPSDEQAVRVMMADMSESVAVLGVIKPLILDLPTAFGSVIQHPTADCFDRGIGEPERFPDLTVRFLLPVEQDAYGFPTQVFPGVEVVGIPKLDAIRTVTEGELGGLGTKSLLRRCRVAHPFAPVVQMRVFYFSR